MIAKLFDFIKQLNTSSKLIGSVILVVFVVSLLVFQTISIRELNEAITAEEKALESDRARLLHIESIKANYKKSLEKLYTLEAGFPNSPSEESILASLQETSERSLTYFNKISFGKTSPGDGLTKISLAVSYTGNFYCLLDLLDKLKNGSRIIRIESLTVAKEKGKDSLKAEMQAIAFFSSPPGSVAPPAGGAVSQEKK